MTKEKLLDKFNAINVFTVKAFGGAGLIVSLASGLTHDITHPRNDFTTSAQVATLQHDRNNWCIGGFGGGVALYGGYLLLANRRQKKEPSPEPTK